MNSLCLAAKHTQGCASGHCLMDDYSGICSLNLAWNSMAMSRIEETEKRPKGRASWEWGWSNRHPYTMSPGVKQERLIAPKVFLNTSFDSMGLELGPFSKFLTRSRGCCCPANHTLNIKYCFVSSSQMVPQKGNQSQ